ncbi:MAG TPA: S-methyl-5'-thioadenosine phosphorylase [Tepidiformaceae bacterium]
MDEPIELAVLGGSGFYEIPGLLISDELVIDTPFGATSDAIRVGTLDGVRVAFLARHGRNHSLLPSEIPQRANFWAFKSLGVRRVVGVSAVGSLRQDYAPGQMVTPDQIMDRTRGARPATFFGEGVVAHASLAEPFCPALRSSAMAAGRAAGAEVHPDGSYVVIEGPAFGTRAESELYRAWGASIVGMTALPEAKLAREAELCYAILASVTDYDAWHIGEEPVDATTVLDVLRHNVVVSQNAIRQLVRNLPADNCSCGTALNAALVTPLAAIDAATRTRLAPILKRRLELTP